MSAVTVNACPPACSTRRSSSAGPVVGSVLTPTSAPSAARRTAVACPIPVVAPVTSATFPSKRRSIGCLSLSEDRDRVPWRPGSAGQPQRQADDHELESPFFLARPGAGLEVQAVGAEQHHSGV